MKAPGVEHAEVLETQVTLGGQAKAFDQQKPTALSEFDLRHLKARVQGGTHAKELIRGQVRIVVSTKRLEQMGGATLGQTLDGGSAIAKQDLGLHAGNPGVPAIGVQQVVKQALGAIMYQLVRQTGWRHRSGLMPGGGHIHPPQLIQTIAPA